MRIDQAGILLERDDKGDYRLRKRINSARFCYEGGDDPDRCGATQQERERPRNVAAAKDGAPAVEAKSFLLAPKQQQFARSRYRIFPRYRSRHLLSRRGHPLAERRSDRQVAGEGAGRPHGDSEPLFVLNPSGVADPLATISYRGKSYSAPAAGTRMAQVVNIVRQLISLNRPAKDIPTTNILMVVGN